MTELSLRVVERDDHHCGLGVTADYGDAPVRLLARNEMSDVRCGVCSDEATAVRTAHTYDETGWLREDCQDDLECRPATFAPDVNARVHTLSNDIPPNDGNRFARNA